jgi:hypothetical protein
MGNLIDYALAFDGSQNYVSLGTMGNFYSNLTNTLYVCATIKMTAIPSSDSRIVANDHTDQNYLGFQLYTTNNGKQILFMVGNGISYVNSQINYGSAPVGQVIQLVGIYDGANVTLYVNGVAQSPYPLTGNVGATINPVWISGNPAYNGDFFPGVIDNVQIGTSSSVLYGSYPGISQPGSGTTLFDRSGNGNNGTLTGSPLPIWITQGGYNITVGQMADQPTLQNSIIIGD